MKFNPILNSMIWGGERILPYKGIASTQTKIGESWELSGVKGSESVVANGALAGETISHLLETYGEELIGVENYQRFGNEFPLLIKFIDAEQDLSIQVHPDDALAEARHQSKGKTEMWYVIDAKPGAKLRSGFSQKVDAAAYVAHLEAGTLTDILQEYEVQKGDLFYLPAGRIHSIGAGCLIAEIQQTSNITYRLYDFDRKDAAGNLRELHTQQALDAIDFRYEKDYRTHYDRESRDCEVSLVTSPYFTTSLMDLTRPYAVDYSELDTFVIYICTEGEATINDTPLCAGETLLLPATTTHIQIDTSGCKIVTTYCKSRI